VSQSTVIVIDPASLLDLVNRSKWSHV
jgi:hypothetical protein